MKFLDAPVEVENVKFLNEIQDVIKKICFELKGTNSKNYQEVLRVFSEVENASIIEIESWIEKNKRDEKMEDIFLNTVSAIDNFVEVYKLKKRPKSRRGESSFVENFVNEAKSFQSEKNSVDFNEAIQVMIETSKLFKVVNKNVVVALFKMATKDFQEGYVKTEKTHEFKYIMNRYIGIVLLKNDNDLLEKYNHYFNTNYQYPNINVVDMPNSEFKTYNALKIHNNNITKDCELDISNISSKATLEEVFKNNMRTTYILKNMNNYHVVKDKNGVYYVIDSKSKFFNTALKNYKTDKNKFHNHNNDIEYYKVYETVLRSIFEKPKFLDKYWLYETENSVGMIEDLDISKNTGSVNWSVWEVDTKEMYVKNQSYHDKDSNYLLSLKPASDLKVMAMVSLLEQCIRRQRMNEMYDKLR